MNFQILLSDFFPERTTEHSLAFDKWSDLLLDESLGGLFRVRILSERDIDYIFADFGNRRSMNIFFSQRVGDCFFKFVQHFGVDTPIVQELF